MSWGGGGGAVFPQSNSSFLMDDNCIWTAGVPNDEIPGFVLLLSCCSSLYILHLTPSQMYQMLTFCPFCILSYHFIFKVFWHIQVLKFEKLNLPIYPVAHGFGVMSKNLLLTPRSWRFASMFSSDSFVVLALIFRTLIHFEFFYVM